VALKVPSAVVVVDTEFTTHPPGGRPVPVCAVGRDIRSGQEWRTFQGEFRPKPPWPTGPDVLFVAYYASAELGFYRALDWPMPERILDLFIEFRNLTNGRQLPSGAGLLGALAFFGLDHIGVVEKKEMQEAIVLRLWRLILAEYRIDDIGGRLLVEQAAHAQDMVVRLRAQIDADGLMVEMRSGWRAHPALKDELGFRCFITSTLKKLGIVDEPVQQHGGRYKQYGGVV
jgi:hypothetical protein